MAHWLRPADFAIEWVASFGVSSNVFPITASTWSFCDRTGPARAWVVVASVEAPLGDAVTPRGDRCRVDTELASHSGVRRATARSGTPRRAPARALGRRAQRSRSHAPDRSALLRRSACPSCHDRLPSSLMTGRARRKGKKSHYGKQL